MRHPSFAGNAARCLFVGLLASCSSSGGTGELTGTDGGSWDGLTASHGSSSRSESSRAVDAGSATASGPSDTGAGTRSGSTSRTGSASASSSDRRSASSSGSGASGAGDGGSGTNLTWINDGDWYTDAQWALAPAYNVVLDKADTYAGSPSWQVTLDSTNTGVDHGNLVIAPGDQIDFSCWIKTSAATVPADDGNPQAGGRIGIDFHGSLGGIVGVSSPDGNPADGPTNSFNTYVPFGTSSWTQVVMSFTVPATYEYEEGTTGQTGHYSTGEMVPPTSCIPWLQVWSDTQGSSENGVAWFADPQFYVTH